MKWSLVDGVWVDSTPELARNCPVTHAARMPMTTGEGHPTFTWSASGAVFIPSCSPTFPGCSVGGIGLFGPNTVLTKAFGTLSHHWPLCVT